MVGAEGHGAPLHLCGPGRHPVHFFPSLWPASVKGALQTLVGWALVGTAGGAGCGGKPRGPFLT